MVTLKGDDQTRYVAEMFNGISARYDLLNTLMSGGMHHFWRRRATKLATESGLGEALDLATGTGDFVLDLAHRPEIVRVVGLDLAPKMLPLARNKAKHHGVSHKVDWILGDALTLPFQKDHFLCITVGFGLRNFSDMQTAIGEMTRVVQPGGRVVILDIIPLMNRGIFHLLQRAYFRVIVPYLGAFIGRNREAYTYLPDSVDNFLTPKELVSMMESSGLQRVRYQMMGMGTVALHVGEKPS